MPRQDIAKYEIHIQCDFCGESVHLDATTPDDKLVQTMSQWMSVFDGDQPPSQDRDTRRWYDSLNCMSSGEGKHRIEKEKAMEEKKRLDEKLARANESLKKSGFMDKALQVAKA